MEGEHAHVRPKVLGTPCNLFNTSHVLADNRENTNHETGGSLGNNGSYFLSKKLQKLERLSAYSIVSIIQI